MSSYDNNPGRGLKLVSEGLRCLLSGLAILPCRDRTLSSANYNNSI